MTTSRRPLRLEHALALVPELDELLPLRDALLGVAREGEGGAGDTVQTRAVELDALEARIPALAEEARRRTEATLRHAVAALRAEQNGDLAAAALALVAAGDEEEAAGRLDAAETWYRRALAVGRRPRDRAPEGLALRRLGRVARARGEAAEGLRLYRLAWEVAEALRDTEGAVVACQGAGNCCGDLGQWEEAEAWYGRGLQEAEALDAPQLRWQLYSNLSAAARRGGRLEQSREWLRRAQEVVGATGDAAGAVFVRNAEGLLRVALGETAEAEAAYRGALDAARDPESRATVLVNLAECLLLQRRPAEAERALREAEQIAAVHGRTGALRDVYRGLGALALHRGSEDGIVYYEEALTLGRRSGAPAGEMAEVQREYARLEAVLGRGAAARDRLQEAERLFAAAGAEPQRAATEAERLSLGPEPENETEK